MLQPKFVISRVKKFVAFLTVIIFANITLLASAELGAHSEEPSDQLIGWKSEEIFTGAASSRIRIQTEAGDDKNSILPVYEVCRSFQEAPCLEAYSKPTDARLLLPHCKSKSESWCIESLFVGRKDQPIKQAKFVRQVKGVTTDSNSKLGYPRGSTISLWDVSESSNLGGVTSYAAYVQIRMARFPDVFPLSTRNGATLTAAILPYREITDFQSPKMVSYRGISIQATNNSVQGRKFEIVGGDVDCVWTEDSKCGVIENFPSDSVAGIRLRVDSSLAGWLMGRLGNPQVKVVKIDDQTSTLEVTAEPLQVPKLFVAVSKNQFTQKLRDTFTEDGYGIQDPQGISQISNADPGIFEIIDSWRDVAKDTNAGLSTAWNFYSVTGGGGSKCLLNPKGLQGIVATNAMAYDGFAPSFKDGALVYQVASFHNNLDGTEFTGTYNLIISRKVANCLYDLQNFPVSASVSILRDDKQDLEIASTSFSQIGKGEDSWLRVNVEGFTFSAPQIRVKFSKKILSITCQKGSVIKKVSNASGKCPKGFKKR